MGEVSSLLGCDVHVSIPFQLSHSPVFFGKWFYESHVMSPIRLIYCEGSGVIWNPLDYPRLSVFHGSSCKFSKRPGLLHVAQVFQAQFHTILLRKFPAFLKIPQE